MEALDLQSTPRKKSNVPIVPDTENQTKSPIVKPIEEMEVDAAIGEVQGNFV